MKLTSCTEVLLGTAYYPDHWPEAEWGRDLDRIVEAGCRVVRFGEFSWSWYEHSAGVYDFAAMDRFVDMVADRGLQLVLCTATATPPPWFDVVFPDGRMQDAYGRPCLAARHFWCWNHGASRAAAERTIRELVGRYKRRTVVTGWQIDNEPNYAEQKHLKNPMEGFDFHPASRRKFVEWLRARYGDDLEALNQAWWSNFWSQRCHTWEEAGLVRGKTNPQAWLDFMRWRDADVASFVHWQRDLIREVLDGAPQAVGCNIPETGTAFSVAIAQDYRAQAEGLDWVGTDLYQATGDRDLDLKRLACSTDLMRSAAGDAHFLISETQAGPHQRWWPTGFCGEAFGPCYLRESAELYARRGARQVWWFLFRATHGGTEMGMNGLQNVDGVDTARSAASRTLAAERVLDGPRNEWSGRPLALIHYSRESLLMGSFWPDVLPLMDDALTGWHSLLEDAGFRVDFIMDGDLNDAGAGLERGELLVLPATPLLSAARLETLARWEGLVVCGPHTGLQDGSGHWTHGETRIRRDRWLGGTAGYWHDHAPFARWLGVEIPGWRELVAGRGAEAGDSFDGSAEGNPVWFSSPGVVMTACDWGALYLRQFAARPQLLDLFLRLHEHKNGRNDGQQPQAVVRKRGGAKNKSPETVAQR